MLGLTQMHEHFLLADNMLRMLSWLDLGLIDHLKRILFTCSFILDPHYHTECTSSNLGSNLEIIQSSTVRLQKMFFVFIVVQIMIIQSRPWFSAFNAGCLAAVWGHREVCITPWYNWPLLLRRALPDLILDALNHDCRWNSLLLHVQFNRLWLRQWQEFIFSFKVLLDSKLLCLQSALFRSHRHHLLLIIILIWICHYCIRILRL